jgi:hypothetical protein
MIINSKFIFNFNLNCTLIFNLHNPKSFTQYHHCYHTRYYYIIYNYIIINEKKKKKKKINFNTDINSFMFDIKLYNELL